MGLRTVLLLLSLLSVGALIGLGLAVTCRPGWYTPLAIDHERLHDDKVALATWQDQISTALNEGREIRVRLEQAQLNRWLAARTELWPQAGPAFDAVDQAFVRLDAGEVLLAAVVGRGHWRGVLTVCGGVDVNGDYLVLRCTGARLGLLPLPARTVCNELWKHTPNAARRNVGASPATLVFPNEFVWPNGKRRCRVRELLLNPGVLEVVLEPLP